MRSGQGNVQGNRRGPIRARQGKEHAQEIVGADDIERKQTGRQRCRLVGRSVCCPTE